MTDYDFYNGELEKLTAQLSDLENIMADIDQDETTPDREILLGELSLERDALLADYNGCLSALELTA